MQTMRTETGRVIIEVRTGRSICSCGRAKVVAPCFANMIVHVSPYEGHGKSTSRRCEAQTRQRIGSRRG